MAGESEEHTSSDSASASARLDSRRQRRRLSLTNEAPQPPSRSAPTEASTRSGAIETSESQPIPPTESVGPSTRRGTGQESPQLGQKRKEPLEAHLQPKALLRPSRA